MLILKKVTMDAIMCPRERERESERESERAREWEREREREVERANERENCKSKYIQGNLLVSCIYIYNGDGKSIIVFIDRTPIKYIYWRHTLIAIASIGRIKYIISREIKGKCGMYSALVCMCIGVSLSVFMYATHLIALASMIEL